MFNLLRVGCVVGLVGAAAMAQPARVAVPVTRTVDHVDDYFGTKVPDPYRWLEDDRAAETKAWVEAQNKVTLGYLAEIPEREKIRERLTAIWNYERFSAPTRRGPHYFYTHNTGVQNQAVLYVAASPQERGRVLIDPNTFAADGSTVLRSTSFTEDGTLVAYTRAKGGADLTTLHVMEVGTGRILPDTLPENRNAFGGWAPDKSGFYYTTFPLPKDRSALTAAFKHHKVYFHRLGTPIEQDVLIHEQADQPDWRFGSAISEDGRWQIIYQSAGTDPKRRVLLRDLTRPGVKVEPFLDRFDAAYSVVGNDGDTFYVLTDKDAPRSRLVAITRGRTDTAQWRTIIPEGPGRDVLAQVELVAERFVATWSIDVLTRVRLYTLDGRPERELAGPGVGMTSVAGGRRRDREIYYTFGSYNRPATLHRYDFATQTSTVSREPRVAFKPDDYEVKQVFYPSKDGTRIPLFLTHRKGLKLDGSAPTLLYGYGGFNISATPAFSPSIAVWLEMGGVYAHAALRGGGEYGRDWHNAGRLKNKQNVFDDFIAAAEWLIANNYTRSGRLAINGGSNGGLLVGACLLQRPDLFGAALPAVGVLDMLRYHKFTVGAGWRSDYLSSETREGFEGLMKYSPLHNVRPGGRYPATLITTGDHDDRVVPAHSFKFAAALQAAQAGPAPILIRVETNAGHGAGKATAKVIAERADVYAFLVRNLGFGLPAEFGR